MLGRLQTFARRPVLRFDLSQYLVSTESTANLTGTENPRCFLLPAKPGTGKWFFRTIYHSPVVNPPTVAELQTLAAKHGMTISDEDMEQYKDHMKKFLTVYDRLQVLPEPGLPVKYLSSSGYVPAQKDNPYNAWARITNTKGAPGGKLAGKTLAVKDTIAMAGVPLTMSSQFMEGCVSAYHATVVSRVLDAGVVIKGKAICENYCLTGSSYSSFPLPVLNPHDTERSSGGSSSGNGALIAAGEVDLGLGTDLGGSIRIPACWCGIVGLKPTLGLVPYTGIVSLGGSFDHVGPMAKNVRDCALLLEVLAGYDGGLDTRQPANLTVQNYTELVTGKISGMKIALIKEGFDGSEPDVEETVKKAAKSLEKLGATVEEISFPAHVSVSAPTISMVTEIIYDTYKSGGLTTFTSRGYKDTLTHDILFNASRSKADTLTPSLKHILLAAAYIREKHGCHFYAKAVNILRDFIAEYDKLFAKYEVLIMPTIKYKAPKLPPADLSVDGYLELHLAMVDNTVPYNATGHPALSINAGFSESLPVGMMIIGKHFDDATVLNVAYAFEGIRDGEKK